MKKSITLCLLLIFISNCKKDNNNTIQIEHRLDEAYVSANRGMSTVEIPAVYEISNIIIALEDQEMSNSSFIETNVPYHQEVLDYFTPYKDHELIQQLDLSSNEGLSNDYFNDHYGFRTNSYAFELDGETLKDKGIYGTLSNRDYFRKNLDLIQDFIITSNAIDFLAEHSDYYQQEIANYKSVVPIQREWDWLETKFPNKVDALKVIFSPLTDGSHNTKSIHAEDGLDYTEILMFIGGLKAEPADLTEVRKIYRERVVFTEIDHNYVNPTSDQYLESINAAMKDLIRWYRLDRYDGAYAIFNEYMTWSVFTLYMKEHYEAADYEEAKVAIEHQMVNSRKFINFPAFNNKLLELYTANPSSIADLYPAILEWVKEEDQ